MQKRQLFGLVAMLLVTAGVILAAKPGAAPQPVAGTVLGEWDLNHDGTPETVVLKGDGEDLQSSVSWELRVLNQDGAVLWSDEAVYSHAGWNTIVVCEADGQDYLLRYDPTMYQGVGSYTYRVFSLNEAGGEVVLAENTLEFDMNFGNPYHEDNFDPAAITAFLEEVHSYLDESTILLSTENMEFQSGTSGADFQWDTAVFWDPLYPYDESKTLLENLEARKE